MSERDVRLTLAQVRNVALKHHQRTKQTIFVGGIDQEFVDSLNGLLAEPDSSNAAPSQVENLLQAWISRRDQHGDVTRLYAIGELKEAIERDRIRASAAPAANAGDELPAELREAQRIEIEQATEYLTSLGIWRGHNLTWRIKEALKAASAAPAKQTPAAPEPWLYAIAEPNGHWQDGENCVFQDLESCQGEVDEYNDQIEEGETKYTVVPLYRGA